MFALTLGLVAIVALYLYTTRTFLYWKKRGVKHDKPIPIFGNFLQVYLGRKSVTQKAVETYWKYPNEKVVGVYIDTRPALVVRDVNIIKQILTIDFNYFYSRGLSSDNCEMEPMLRNLFYADGDVWRLLRQRMTAAFTTGKLQAMFPLIIDRAEQLKTRVMLAAVSESVIDARELMARFATDFIGACGFGLDANSLNNENSAFRQLGVKIFDTGPVIILKSILKELFPRLFKNIKYYTEIEKELITLVKQILEQRKYEPSDRNDFIDLLIDCKKKGKILGESIEKIKIDGSPENVELDLDEVIMAAQVFVFFAAGFETSSSSTSFTLHQLAYHPEVQKKVQEEIDRVLANYNNRLCYDAIKDMSYLSWAFKESMRICSPLGVLSRKSVRLYEFKDLNFSIAEDIRIIIPLHALHNDPQYFDNPEEFRPERFDPGQFKQDNKYVYLPFGVGPRACIGERLGLMQSLSGLASILSCFTVVPAPESLRRPILNPASFISQGIKGGLPLLFKERPVL